MDGAMPRIDPPVARPDNGAAPREDATPDASPGRETPPRTPPAMTPPPRTVAVPPFDAAGTLHSSGRRTACVSPVTHARFGAASGRGADSPPEPPKLPRGDDSSTDSDVGAPSSRGADARKDGDVAAGAAPRPMPAWVPPWAADALSQCMAHPHLSMQLVAAAWMALQALYFFALRGVSMAGFPYDGLQAWKLGEAFDALSALLRWTFVMVVMTGVAAEKRAWYLVWTKRAWFWPAYLCAGVALSFLGNVPTLRHSVADSHQWSAETAAIFGVGIAAAAGVGAYLIWRAHRTLPRAHFWRFYVPRVVCAALFYLIPTTIFLVATEADPSEYSVRAHFHHYVIAALFLLLVEGLDGRVPAAVTGACLSLLAQGIAAYNAEPVFYDGDRFYFAQTAPCQSHVQASAWETCRWFEASPVVWNSGAHIELNPPEYWSTLTQARNVSVVACLDRFVGGQRVDAAAILRASDPDVLEYNPFESL
ncbi:unnamed protein product [Pedinophyceae sp. YPF-701]|nr:unnamed protein product [Pedinophyceae sp. YPF-701]